METRFEPFLHLADVGPDRALIAWGGFWFRRQERDGRWGIVDDSELGEVDPGRQETIGARSEPYGDAVVEVSDESGTVVATAGTGEVNHTWVTGLRPDTAYRYRVLVGGQEWAAGERWDWGPVDRGGLDLRPGGRAYDTAFRTHPEPGVDAPLDFAVLGDYGVGVVSDSESSRRQTRVARVLDALVERHGVRVVVGVGDNVYRGESGLVGAEGGGEDDDWYSSFYQPYRYLLARIPVYPTVGNHDSTDTEGSDDRDQIRDNFHTDERFLPAVGSGRASIEPGLFYSFGFGAAVEFVCIDTSLAEELPVEHYFEDPKHREWLESALPDDSSDGPRWRIPFSHHPTYCAGPHHPNTQNMVDELVPLFRRSGVRVAFAGHEHNFQLSRADGIDYFLTGAGGKLREDPPTEFEDAHTVAWSAQSHLLHVRVDGATMTVTPYAGLTDDGRPSPMTALTPRNGVVEVPFVVEAGR
jgi:tartrate-resistant acid phosphatase type 5